MKNQFVLLLMFLTCNLADGLTQHEIYQKNKFNTYEQYVDYIFQLEDKNIQKTSENIQEVELETKDSLGYIKGIYVQTSYISLILCSPEYPVSSKVKLLRSALKNQYERDVYSLLLNETIPCISDQKGLSDSLAALFLEHQQIDRNNIRFKLFLVHNRIIQSRDSLLNIVNEAISSPYTSMNVNLAFILEEYGYYNESIRYLKHLIGKLSENIYFYKELENNPKSFLVFENLIFNKDSVISQKAYDLAVELMDLTLKKDILLQGLILPLGWKLKHHYLQMLKIHEDRLYQLAKKSDPHTYFSFLEKFSPVLGISEPEYLWEKIIRSKELYEDKYLDYEKLSARAARYCVASNISYEKKVQILQEFKSNHSALKADSKIKSSTAIQQLILVLHSFSPKLKYELQESFVPSFYKANYLFPMEYKKMQSNNFGQIISFDIVDSILSKISDLQYKKEIAQYKWERLNGDIINFLNYYNQVKALPALKYYGYNVTLKEILNHHLLPALREHQINHIKIIQSSDNIIVKGTNSTYIVNGFENESSYHWTPIFKAINRVLKEDNVKYRIFFFNKEPSTEQHFGIFIPNEIQPLVELFNSMEFKYGKDQVKK